MLDKSSNTPLYLQLKELIYDRITKGIYEIGESIPSESEIQKQYNISRITVRRAVMELEKKGYLVKRPGKGTFVKKEKAEEKVAQELNNISTWTETMKKQGYKPGTSHIEISTVVPPEEVAQVLNINSDTKVVKIKRYRTGNGIPFSIMNNFILQHFVPDIEKSGLANESLYNVLEKKYNIKFGKATEMVEARKATEEESEFFNIDEVSPVLAITRYTYDPNGEPFEVVKQATRADLYKYVVTLKGKTGRRSK